MPPKEAEGHALTLPYSVGEMPPKEVEGHALTLPHSVGEMPPKEVEGAQPGCPNPRSAVPPTGRVPKYTADGTAGPKRFAAPIPHPHCPSGESPPPPRAGETTNPTACGDISPGCVSGWKQSEHGPVGGLVSPVGVISVPIPCPVAVTATGRWARPSRPGPEGDAELVATHCWSNRPPPLPPAGASPPAAGEKRTERHQSFGSPSALRRSRRQRRRRKGPCLARCQAGPGPSSCSMRTAILAVQVSSAAGGTRSSTRVATPDRAFAEGAVG